MGRPSTFTQEMGTKICDEIASGRSLRKICDAEDMPCMSTVMKWLAKGGARSQSGGDGLFVEFAHQYARARENQAEFYLEKIDRIQEQVLNKEVNPNAGRVAIDAIKWMMSKMMPKKYSDRFQVDTKSVTDVDLEKRLSTALATKDE